MPVVTYQQHQNLAEKQILMTTVDVCAIMFTWLLMAAIEFQVAVYNTETLVVSQELVPVLASQL